MPRGDNVVLLEDDPLWFKDACIYELHVRAFYDSNGDGIGDIAGVTRKLDYLQDLGVTALWLLPLCPSPWRDEGYDISDYFNIHQSYGTMAEFRAFLHEAHRRGLRVITELVVNHTSDQHPWFQRARRAKPGSQARNFYVWSDTTERYKDARIIFKDFETSNWTWDPVAGAYYWHRFYSHQPDLNYDSPQVRRSIRQILDFWLGMGVDGLRLDAVPYLFEREGTNCENLPETHAYLKELRRYVDSKYANRMILAEANQWPEDAAAYFGQGDECHMNFHFPLMPRLFMALRMEDCYPIIDIERQTPEIPETCQWGIFLRNHDELTLEMVTDEERDYMYRAYANDPQMRVNLGIRRRLAPLLGNDRRKIELLYGLLFSLPGTPVLYYGEELGMGDNVYLRDRDAVRTPMQWSPDRNAGFSQTNPQRLYMPIILDPEYHYEALNVENQQNNPNSMLWWMKRVMSIRKRFKVFGRGSVTFLYPDNRKILAFIRQYQEECVLVVANLSRYPQSVALDLSAHQGVVPIELSGQAKFPMIGSQPYPLMLGTHAFYAFKLEVQPPETLAVGPQALPVLSVRGSWDAILRGRNKTALEAALPTYLQARRWFAGKARIIQRITLQETIPLPRDTPVGYLALLHVTYTEGEPEDYLLPLAWTADERLADLQDSPAAVARVRVQDRSTAEEGLLYDGLYDPRFATALLELVSRNRRTASQTHPGLHASPVRAFQARLRAAVGTLEPRLLGAEQSNTSIVFGDEFILKLFRRVEVGMNPDLEIGRYLTAVRNFPSIAPVAAGLEFQRPKAEPMTLAIVQRFLPNQGDAWRYSLDTLGRYFPEALARQAEISSVPLPTGKLFALSQEEIPALANELIGFYLESAQILGQRTAELHLALAQEKDDANFAPEAFTDFYRQALYQGLLSHSSQATQLLRQRLPHLPDSVRSDAEAVLAREAEIRRRFRALRDQRISALRIRCHGDYHLGQVLHTGKDFIILDFEGEPARPLSVRRMKRCPLRDVAGMLRSFHYAAYAALLGQVPGIRPEDFESIEPWARFWYTWVSADFLKAYLAVAGSGGFLPEKTTDMQILLDAYLLEKALYELMYELNSRPDWVKVPLQGIVSLLDAV